MGFLILFLAPFGVIVLIALGFALLYWVIKAAVRNGVTEAMQIMQTDRQAASPDTEDEKRNE